MVLQSFVITLREGLEAFLIVAISLAYLERPVGVQLIPAVKWGIAISIALSIGRWLSAPTSPQPGALGGCARARRGGFRDDAHHPHVADGPAHEGATSKAASSCRRAAAAARRFSAFSASPCSMITREGMETALLMNTLLFQMSNAQLLIGRHWRERSRPPLSRGSGPDTAIA